MVRRKEHFPRHVRREMRQEQDYACAICGTSCRGHKFNEPPLEAHHIIPVSKGGTHEKHNCVGLCNENSCHETADYVAIKEGKFFDEVVMTEGVEYYLNHPMREVFMDRRRRRELVRMNEIRDELYSMVAD